MRNIFISIMVLMTVLMYYGCDADEGEHGGSGFIPKIETIISYNYNDPESPVSTTSYAIGDEVRFSIEVEDVDLDVETLRGTLYEYGTDNIITGPIDVQLTEQTTKSMIYYYIFPITIEGPAGDYSMVFVVEDANGNQSSTLTLSYVVD